MLTCTAHSFLCGTRCVWICGLHCFLSFAYFSFHTLPRSSVCPEVQDRVEEGRDCVCSCAALAEVMHTRSPPLIVSFFCLWRYLPPGSVDCGGGTQSRSVTCQTAAGAVVADSSCPAASKPAASRACGEGVCVVGSWVRSSSQSPPLCDFVSFPTLTSHSISFTGAQGAPKLKIVVVSVACCAGFRAHTAQFCPVSVLVHPELSTSVCVWIRLPCVLV